MKIKDILNIISEQPAQPTAAPTAAPKQNAGTAAGYKGSAAAQALAKANGIANPNEIKAGKVIQVNGQPYTIKAGDTLDKIAAANKGSAAPATANAGSGGADQNAAGVSNQVAAAQGKPVATNAATLAAAQGKEVPTDTADAETGTEPGQATMAPAPEGPTGQDAPSAENEKAKVGIAAGSPALQGQSAQPEAPASQTPDEIARLQQLGGIPQGQVASPFGQKPPAGPVATMPGIQAQANIPGSPTSGSPMAGVNTSSNGQSAQPVAPAANPSAGAAPVKTGTGGTLTTRDGKPVTTRSDNEIWWSQQPGNMGKQYPGDAVAQQQYDARQAAGKQNMDALKGVGNKIANFFGGGKKPNNQGQAQQPNRLNDPNSLTRSPAPAVTMENEELSRIINLIHHR